MAEELLRCPLITNYTSTIGINPDVLEKLFVLRQWDIEKGDPIPFKWPALLRKELSPGVPLDLRQYQIQMVHHLCRMPKFINGDAVGLGKTIEAIAAAAWLKERFPDAKVVILATKSTTWQWYDEIIRFSLLQPYVMQDTYKGMSGHNARLAQMMTFLEDKGLRKKDVMICKYSSLIGKRRIIEDKDGFKKKELVSQEIKAMATVFKQHGENIILITDECQKYKTPGTSIRKLVMALARSTGKTWALSATVIKNGLDEFYNIAYAIGIRPLGDLSDFAEEFCKFYDQYIGNGRTIPVLAGYKNVPRFKEQLRPFFLGRSQKQVKEPLPLLSTLFHPVELDAKQTKLLLEDIPNGTFQLPPAIIKEAGQIFEKERDASNQMTMLSVQQLVANHWALIDRNNEKDFHTPTLSPKEEALLDMLDGDFRGEKIIVFTKYRSWIDRLEWLTKNSHLTKREFLRITGNEDEKQRRVAKALFQDPESQHDLIVINSAGIEGINLQQAAHMICLDLPWSWGDLIQLVGRMVRMASPHSACTLHVMVAKGTIDEYTVETLKGKKGVFEKILGESHSAGILDDKLLHDLDSGMEHVGSDEEFKSMLHAHCKSVGMKTFLEGDLITAAAGNEDYKMVFEKTKTKRGKRRLPTDEEIAAKWNL
jgi:SNF2 family DNA or RNA helicase